MIDLLLRFKAVAWQKKETGDGRLVLINIIIFFVREKKLL